MRKDDIYKRIEWAHQNNENVAKELRYNNNIDIDIEKCIKLISECLEHLNTVYDYFIHDFVEKSAILINRDYYFPFSQIVNKNPLINLPKSYFNFINDIAIKFDTEEIIPNTNIKYNIIKKMRKLVNSGKHNNISANMNTVDTGDIQYEFGGGSVIVHSAENLENQGYIVNPHMDKKGKVLNLFFNDTEILENDEREVFHFCTYLISGTKKIIEIGYHFIE